LRIFSHHFSVIFFDFISLNVGISSVQPGLLVAGTVFRILESGLVIRFLDLFYGSVDLLHLSEPGSSDWQSKYEEGQVALSVVSISFSSTISQFLCCFLQAVTARVVFVSQAAKRISLSLRPHIVSGQGFAPLATASSFKTGDRVNARVIRVDNGLGLLTELTLENAIEHTPAENTKKSSKTESTLYGYCHISHAADEKVEHLNQKFAVGTVHSARVLFTHALDGVFNVSMRASVLAQVWILSNSYSIFFMLVSICVYSMFQTVLAAEDLHAGDTVEGEVTQVVDAGLVVRITPRLSALCPVAHWADVAPSSAQAKKKAAARFPIGSRQTFRVLEVHF
jgi:rRNA biogenesis protein RRP5